MDDSAPDTPRGAVVPGPRRQFDHRVADCLDGMLARSIPDYHSRRDLVTRLASRLILPGTDVVDLGASRGSAVTLLIERFGATVTWHLVQVPEPMLEALPRRFAGRPPENRPPRPPLAPDQPGYSEVGRDA